MSVAWQRVIRKKVRSSARIMLPIVLVVAAALGSLLLRSRTLYRLVWYYKPPERGGGWFAVAMRLWRTSRRSFAVSSISSGQLLNVNFEFQR